jgi:hypothetical protein
VCPVLRLLNLTAMLGRRSDARYGFTEPIGGTMSVYSDVIVKWSGDDEWIAISREPAAAGEMLHLDVDDGEQWNQFPVCVIESRPVIVHGDMRHRIRLHRAGRSIASFEQQLRRG